MIIGKDDIATLYWNSKIHWKSYPMYTENMDQLFILDDLDGLPRTINCITNKAKCY